MSKTVILNESMIDKKHKSKHESFEFFKMEITKKTEFNHMNAAFYEVPPQKSACPFHFHENVTELFYIISGEGLVKTADGEKPVKPGDVLVFSPGEEGAHKITNTSDSTMLVYLDVGAKELLDVVHYPDSKKIGVIKQNEYSKFYKEEDNDDYYMDEK